MSVTYKTTIVLNG